MCVYCPTRLSSESLSRRNIPKDNLSDTWSTTLASTVILPLILPRLFLVAAIPAKVILEAPRAEHPIATSAPHLVFVRTKLIAILAIAIRGVVEVETQQRLPFAHDTHWFRLLLAVMRDLAATLRTFLGQPENAIALLKFQPTTCAADQCTRTRGEYLRASATFLIVFIWCYQLCLLARGLAKDSGAQ